MKKSESAPGDLVSISHDFSVLGICVSSKTYDSAYRMLKPRYVISLEMQSLSHSRVLVTSGVDATQRTLWSSSNGRG